MNSLNRCLLWLRLHTKLAITLAMLIPVAAVFMVVLLQHSKSQSVTISKAGYSPEILLESHQVADTVDKNGSEIKIYVVGCVKSPGIVTLQKGQMVDDAITKAGGFTKDADAENINLVYVLQENVMLKVESKRAKHKSVIIPSQQQLALRIVKGICPNCNDKNDSSSCDDSFPSKININIASEELLDKLPGIGSSTAKAIVAYRQNNGKFKTKADILKVPGIGQSKLEKIESSITID